jgi:hypothetical protein
MAEPTKGLITNCSQLDTDLTSVVMGDLLGGDVKKLRFTGLNIGRFVRQSRQNSFVEDRR